MRRSNGAEFKGAPYESGEAYMKEKRRKLLEQNDKAEKVSNILQGVSLYFDGYLGQDMTMIEWRDFVLRHGAKVYDWLTSAVTHIVAENITDRKFDLWKLKKVVKPSWLTDSVAAGKLLPWHTYQLVSYKSHMQPVLPFAEAPKAKNVSPPKGYGDDLGWYDDMFKPAGTESEDWMKKNVSTAPGFLEKYYTSSRLSKISNWKQELRDFVANYKRDGKPTKQSNVTTNTLRTVFHVDMDCFFASIAMRDRPNLRMRPIAVCHSAGVASKASTSEIASCNYIARKFGCRNGMLLGKAQSLCPDLVMVPYEFEKYDECAKKLYSILLELADDVMALSCDEAFADFSSQIKERGQGELELAERIRAEIFEATGCSASIGIGDNMLLARVATHKAKPNGAFQILQSDALSYLSTLPVGDLPGVGYHMTAQLEFLKVHTCGDLQQLSISKCKEVFGDVKGQKLWEFCRGIDSRSFSAKARQSVGAEVNWGVRFEALDQIVKFIGELAGEVESRLKKARVKGSQITVKAKEKLYEGEPVKVLGCGACTDHSKSKALPFVTDDGAAIALVAVDLFKSFNIPASEVRGIGIQITKLQDHLSISPRQQRLSTSLFHQGSMSKDKAQEHQEFGTSTSLSRHVEPGNPASTSRRMMPNSLADIDPEVFDSLPPEIQMEIKSALLNASKPQPTLPPPLPPSNLEHIAQPSCKLEVATPALGGYTDLLSIRQLLRQWISYTKRPGSSEISELQSFLGSWLALEECDKVVSLISFLRDLISIKNDRQWRLFYNELLLWTKHEFLQLYSKPVKLPGSFIFQNEVQ